MTTDATQDGTSTMANALCTPPLMPLLKPEQAADILGIDVAELDAQQAAGIAPKHHAIGYGLIRYNTADVLRRCA